MRIHVVHETIYRYERPVKGLIQLLRLTPRSHDGQHVREWRIEPNVDGRLVLREDAFGNIVHVFSADQTADEVVLTATGIAETHETHGLVRGAVERVADLFYLRETGLTLADSELRAFAEKAAGRGHAAEPLSALHRLLSAIHDEVAFDPGATEPARNAAEAFARRRGTHQDLSHIFIATARHLGIPTRCVSGYFHRADGIVEHRRGHAWAEARLPGFGWVGFDPAHGICSSAAHVRVAIGLDYLGASPVRGSRYGGGSETLRVTLRVESPGPRQVQSQRQD
jgi:transglutaminase-like putative cysteine protease